jgi:hypothetical protein
MKDIGKEYGVSRTVITRVLKENNIENNDRHKYEADYSKFHHIDTPEKAYWLGFIAADGCVYKRSTNGSVILNLSRKDRDHLVKFKNFMNSNVEINDFIQDCGFSNNTPMSKITFNSKNMVEDFIAHGVGQKKSLVLKPPIIEEEFYLPFILGYFDGDGSIYKTKQYNNYAINIVGTKEILEWINSILDISSHLEKRNDDDKNNYYIRCGGTEKPYKILTKLYNSCSEHLDRKYQIYKELETVVS